MMEVFAGFLEHSDHHIGRLLDFLRELGELDNTLIMVLSDNGTSSEGGPSGSVNENPVPQLVRRWLLTFGPGTRDDIAWWTGWGVGATRQALATVGAVEVRLDGGQVGYVLPDGLEQVDAETAGMIDAEAERLAAWLGRRGSGGRSRQHDA